MRGVSDGGRIRENSDAIDIIGVCLGLRAKRRFKFWPKKRITRD